MSRLLVRLEHGDDQAFDELFAVVYEELRVLGRRRRRRWQGHETLNTTALVHEAYVKLAAGSDVTWQSKAHFMAAASRAIRHILINHARDQGARKRGGGWRRITFERVGPLIGAGSERSAPQFETMIALDDALRRLAGFSERLSRIVECRFFGGMTIEQTAASLDVSTATVTRGWVTAQAWLYRELRDPPRATAQ